CSQALCTIGDCPCGRRYCPRATPRGWAGDTLQVGVALQSALTAGGLVALAGSCPYGWLPLQGALAIADRPCRGLTMASRPCKGPGYGLSPLHGARSWHPSSFLVAFIAKT
ncbi:hypothetical protein B296_00026598, partial [Ensete ventricosum]